MDKTAILNIYKSTVENPEYSSSPLDKALLDMKMQGDVSSLFQKNKRRRSKKDKAGRDYYCGCGKTYLSYPALYTHIKNKHDSSAPEGTTSQHQSRVRPGRPPKSRILMNKNANQNSLKKSLNLSESKNELESNQDSDSNASELNVGFSKLQKKKEEEEIKKKKRFILDSFNLVEKLDCKGSANPVSCFPKKRNIMTNQFITHPFVDLINNLNINKHSEEFYNILNCDKVFSLFLFNLAKVSNKQFYSYCAMVLRALRDCLNGFGYQLLDLYERQNNEQKVELWKGNEEKEKKSKTIFTQIEPSWYITLLFDFFVKEYFPGYLGTTEFNFDLICTFLMAFNDWLQENTLTRIKCCFNY